MNLYLDKENNPDKLILTFSDASQQDGEQRLYFSRLNGGVENKPVSEDWDIQLRYYKGYEYFGKDEHLLGHDSTDTYWKEQKGYIFIRDDNNELKAIKENEGVKWNPEFLGMKRFTLDETTNKFFRSDRSMTSIIPSSNRTVNDEPRDMYEIMRSKPGILPSDIGA